MRSAQWASKGFLKYDLSSFHVLQVGHPFWHRNNSARRNTDLLLLRQTNKLERVKATAFPSGVSLVDSRQRKFTFTSFTAE